MRPFLYRCLVPALALAMLLGTVASIPSARASGGDGIDTSLDANGLLSVGIGVTDPNGSALRYAIDGQFAPLINALPIANATKQQILANITNAESSLLSSFFFGNRDGTVEPGEVTLFETLLEQEARLIPTSAFTGTSGVGIELNGAGPTSLTIVAISLSGAGGADSSSAPIAIATTVSYQFAAHAGAQTLSFTLGVPSSVPTLPGFGPSVSVTFTSPKGTTITSVGGLSGSSTASDPWGFGSSTVRGEYQPLSASGVTIEFGPSFPTGYVALGAAGIGVLVAVGFVLLRARRRRRGAKPALYPSQPPGEGDRPSGSA